MTITIRISGEHAKAAAETLTQNIGSLPIGKPEGQDSFVTMKPDGTAELLLGVNAKLFNSFVAPVLAPHIRLDSNPKGIFSPDATWDQNLGVLALKAI